MSSAAHIALLVIIFSLLFGGICCLDDVALSPISETASPSRYLAPGEGTPSYAPTPGIFNRDGTPSGYSPSPSRGRRSSTPLRHSPLQDYIRDTEWDIAGIAGGEQYLMVRYSIERRVTLNNRVVAKDMEQDLDLDTNFYCSGNKQRAEDLLHRKIARTTGETRRHYGSDLCKWSLTARSCQAL